jgi:hypothetical protein
MVRGSHTDTVAMTSRRSLTVVDLTCQHKNQALLVEGPEVMIRPVGTRPQSMRGRFSADQLQAMIDLYKSGTTTEQLAHTSGFSTRTIHNLQETVWQIRQAINGGDAPARSVKTITREGGPKAEAKQSDKSFWLTMLPGTPSCRRRSTYS